MIRLQKIKQLIKAVLFLFVLVTSSSQVYGAEISAVEFKLVNLINQERQILQDQQETLVLNSVLCRVAQNHARQYLVDEFVLAQKMDENVFINIEEAGYKAVKSGEIKSMVIFSNYLASDNAAHILFESIQKQSTGIEDLEEDDTVFSSQFSELGVHVFETSIFYGRTRFNVYLAVIIYAQPVNNVTENDILEARFFNLINQARSQPLEVLALNDIPIENPDKNLAGDDYFPPVIMVDLMDPEAVLTYSYESRGFNNPNDTIKTIFTHMLEDAVLLNPRFTAVDIDITTGLVELDGINHIKYDIRVGLGTIDIPDNIIAGLFYLDDNLNNFYDPGEEFAHTPMIVYDAGIHTKTGIAGGIMEAVENAGKGYQLVLFPPGHEMMIQDVSINEPVNRFVMIQIKDKSLE